MVFKRTRQIRKHAKRGLAACVVVIGLAVGGAVSASAYWVSGANVGSSSSPIVSSLGKFYGSFWNESNYEARLGEHWVRNSANVGQDRVYSSNSYYLWWYTDLQGATRTTSAGKFVSYLSSSNAWQYDWGSYRLKDDGYQARSVNTKICRDRSYQPDPCSANKAQPTFTY